MHSGNLIFFEKFDEQEFRKKWNCETLPPRHVNNELQRYSESALRFENNELVIQTTVNGRDIKSGRVNTKGKVEIKYGYIEAEIKFSGGKGLWPAFWMLGNNLKWPDCGEIDIMEWVGWNRDALYATVHGPNYCGGNGCGNHGDKKIHNLDNQWHKYSIEWKENSIKWFIDDQLFFELNPGILHSRRNGSHWVFNDRPFYLILNNAVGGNFGGAFHNSEQEIYNNLPKYNEYRIRNLKIFKTLDNQGEVFIK